MNLNNLITSRNYTIPEDGIANPVLSKITEVTGYQWKTYTPSTDVFTYDYVIDAESFYCKGVYDERLSPDGKMLLYYFTEEEQMKCKIKEANSFNGRYFWVVK